MRIIGHIPHPVMKITVFVMDMKFAVKLEAGLLEQTFKFRESEQIKNLEDIKAMLDAAFLESCLSRFEQMHQDLGAAFRRVAG